MFQTQKKVREFSSPFDYQVQISGRWYARLPCFFLWSRPACNIRRVTQAFFIFFKDLLQPVALDPSLVAQPFAHTSKRGRRLEKVSEIGRNVSGAHGSGKTTLSYAIFGTEIKERKD